ncbi:MAG: tripartite tricarboxylate transporter substrate-binding protein [Pseudomonadota bacterium]
MRLLKTTLALAAATVFTATTSVHAQDYPVRPIKLIIPQGVAGGSDLVARAMATEIQQRLGQPFVVENKPGGNETIGPDIVAKAPPDGYTIGIISSTYSINQTHVGPKLPYDPQKAFTPIAPMVRIPMIVMVRTDLGVNDLRQLAAVSKAQPGKLNYGSGGPTTFQGMATEWLRRLSGSDLTAVTYGGAGQLQGIMGGDLHVLLGGPAAAAPVMASGKAKVIATTGATRSLISPNIPTVAETYPGYEIVPWYGFVAPAGTPPAVVKKLNEAITGAITAITPKLMEMGNEPMKMTPAEFQAFMNKDLDLWKKIADAVK